MRMRKLTKLSLVKHNISISLTVLLILVLLGQNLSFMAFANPEHRITANQVDIQRHIASFETTFQQTNEKESEIELPGRWKPTESVLLRVSVYEVSDSVTGYINGVPFLFVENGAGSATTVARVNNGKLRLYFDREIVYTVEVLARFGGLDFSAGTIRALENPALVVDNVSSLGLGETDTFSIDALGKGGVPSDGVRAIFVTFEIEAFKETVIKFADQEVSLSKGNNIFTTVTALAGSKTISIATDGNVSRLRTFVRGWVAEADYNNPEVNSYGSFIPRVGELQKIQIGSKEKIAKVRNDAFDEGIYHLALVNIRKSETTQVLKIGEAALKRPQGTVLTENMSSAVDLVLVKGSSEVVAWASRGSVAFDLQMLGTFVSSADSVSADMEVTFANNGDVQKLAELGGYLTLKGTIEGSRVPAHLELWYGNKSLGNPRIRYTSKSVEWEFKTLIPNSGKYRFEVHAYGVNGEIAKAESTFEVVAPSHDETIYASSVIQIGVDDSGRSLITELSESYLVISGNPKLAAGDVIVSGYSSEHPQGVLRKVKAVERFGKETKIYTEPAQLTDAFVQLKVDARGLFSESEESVSKPTPLYELHSTKTRIPVTERSFRSGPTTSVNVELKKNGLRKYGKERESEASVDYNVDYNHECIEKTRNAKEVLACKGNAALDEIFSYSESITHSTSKDNFTIEVSGDADIQVETVNSIYVAIDISPRKWLGYRLPEFNKFELVVGQDRAFSLEAEISAKAEYEREIRKSALTGKEIRKSFRKPFVIPSTPIVLTAGLSFNVKLSINFYGAIVSELDKTIKTQYEYGFSYDASRKHQPFKTISNSGADSSGGLLDASNLGLEGGVDISLPVQLEVFVTVFEIVGVAVGGEVTPGLDLALISPKLNHNPTDVREEGYDKDEVWRLRGKPYLKLEIYGKPTSLLIDFLEAQDLISEYKLVGFSKEYTFDVTEFDLTRKFKALKVYASELNTLALMGNGDVFSWGYNAIGQVGTGDTVTYTVPKLLAGFEDVIDVSRGDYHALAVKSDGSLWGWGGNMNGELGRTSIASSSVPIQILGLDNIKDVEAGQGNSIAIDVEGGLYVWGGYLESRFDKSVLSKPTKVLGLPRIVQASAGNGGSMYALDEGGKVYRIEHSLSNPTAGNEFLKITPIDFEEKITKISADRLVLSASGKVFPLDRKSFSNNVADVLEKIGPIKDIESGKYTSFVITDEGRVYAWGENNTGQLANGTFETNDAPTQIKNLYNIVQVSAGPEHVVALDDNGQIFGWGKSRSGTLGNTYSGYYLRPIRIGHVPGSKLPIPRSDVPDRPL